MDPDQIEALHNCITGYFVSDPTFTTTTFRRFGELLRHISLEFPDFSADSWPELTAASALIMAGPRRELLPSSVLQHFLGVTADFPEKSIERVLECAVAYGCGKWRKVDESGSIWERIWAPSFTQLSQAMEPAVKEVNIWLSDHLIGYVKREFWYGRDPVFREGADIIACDATLLALRLIDPVKYFLAIEDQKLTIECDESQVIISLDGKSIWQELRPGGRIVFKLLSACQFLREPVRRDTDIRILEKGDSINILALDDGARISFSGSQSNIFLKQNQSACLSQAVGLGAYLCSCGHKDCFNRHSLEGWNAGLDISLWSYCASAVKGPHMNVQTGTLIQSLYYSMLSTSGNFDGTRVRDVLVEYKLCQSTECLNGGHYRRYEGQSCPSCHVAGTPAFTPRKLYKRLILAGENEAYKRVKRFRCKNDHSSNDNKEAYLENISEEPVCSLCNAELNESRPLTAWVRVFSPSLTSEQIDKKIINLPAMEEVDEYGRFDKSSYDSGMYDQEEVYDD